MAKQSKADFESQLRQAEALADGARAVLSLSAFFAPEDIPTELFLQGARTYPPAMSMIADDPDQLERAVQALQQLSLVTVKGTGDNQTISVSPGVQAFIREALGAESAAWIGAAVDAVELGLPGHEPHWYPYFERLVPHVFAVARHAPDSVGGPLSELLGRTALYLSGRDRRDAALPLYERALAIRKLAQMADDPAVSPILNNLAEIYRTQIRLALAEELYQRTLAIEGLEDDPELSLALNNLAEIYRNQNRLDHAEPLYRRALAINEKVLGQDHQAVAQVLSNMGLLYATQHKHDLALPLYQRALAILERKLAPDHPDIAATINNLAGLYEDLGDNGLAEIHYRRALAIRENALAPDHPALATSLNNLSVFLYTQDQFAEALPLAQRALGIFKRVLGSKHATSISVAKTVSKIEAALHSQPR